MCKGMCEVDSDCTHASLIQKLIEFMIQSMTSLAMCSAISCPNFSLFVRTVSQQMMGSRGQFARSGVDHHSVTTPTSPSKARPTKVQPAAPKSKVAKESSSPSTDVQAEPGKSPDVRVAETQARVSRLQAA